MAEWHFIRHTRRDDPYNPLGGEHFNQGVGGDDWAAGESLVREAIQNSLDARVSANDEASVVFHVSDPLGMTAQTAAQWFGSLWPHLRAEECKLRNIHPQPTKGGFIVVEDFGTKGLEGDLSQWQSPREGQDNDFFWFFRADGLSGKKEKSGGSWGVGKSVFNRASMINTFLAISVRRKERDTIVIGKSLLWHHYLGEHEYRAVGKFGIPSKEDTDFIVPTTDSAILKQMVKDFTIRRPLGLDREGDPEPGLSVIIPFSDPDITADSLLTVVVREYFQPILNGKLRVTLSGYGLARRAVSLDKDSIIDEVESLGRRDLSNLVNLAQWSREGVGSAFALRPQTSDQSPRWSDDLFPTEQDQFKTLCEAFEKGDSVAIRVPIQVYPVDGKPQWSHFVVFLRRDLEGDGYRPVYVRGDIVVPNVRKHSVGPLFALVSIEDQPLAEMLRAAEPPAHEKWDHRTENFRGLYQYGKQTIDFVVAAPKYLVDFLSSTRTERDVLALADFFPDPDDSGPQTEDGANERGKKRTKKTITVPPPKPRPFRIERIQEGFRVVRDNAGDTGLPVGLQIKVAYDTSRGSALAKYHPADFDLSKMSQRLDRADVMSCNGNIMELVPKDDNFHVEVTGFDQNRDLYIKVRTLDSLSVEGSD